MKKIALTAAGALFAALALAGAAGAVDSGLSSTPSADDQKNYWESDTDNYWETAGNYWDE